MTRRAPAELWTAAQAAAADRHTMDVVGIPSAVLMERAALAVARVVLEYAGPSGLSVVAVAGPGNNGADAVACARILSGWGHAAQVALARLPSGGMLAEQVRWARSLGVGVRGPEDALPEGRFVWVDGLLGTGSRGAPRGDVAARLSSLSDRTGPVVAVDLPSGVDPDSGAVADNAVTADVTVTFGRSKPGLHVTPGRDRAGRVVVAEIGLQAPSGVSGGRFVLVDPVRVADVVAGLPAGPHKGARGHVVVVGGGAGTVGAAVLAGAAALRAGAGLVTVTSPVAAVREVVARTRPELMTAGTCDPEGFSGARAAVVGPGLTAGAVFGEVVRAWWDRFPGPLVVDAGALDVLPLAPTASGAGRVLTPHPGEAARILQRLWKRAVTAAEVQADRIGVAVELARTFGAVVMLKGAGTLVADPGGWTAICTEGSSVLSTAGTGDVLAGLVGALLARGASPWDAAACGCYVHAAAGEVTAAGTAGGGVRAGVVATDVADALPGVMAEVPEPRAYPSRALA